MIPDFQSIMRPMLDLLADGEARDTVWLRVAIASRFGVTDEEQTERLPSGTGKRFDNRVSWAYVHLQHAGAIERVNRGVYKITPRGLTLLAENPDRVDLKVLAKYPEYLAFRQRGSREKREAVDRPSAEPDAERPPVERLAEAHADHHAELAADLLARIRACEPTFFEQLVLKVLVAMNYGGSEKEASEHLGRSGDGGIDGVINEDTLGLDRVYVQAKRWAENKVRRPDIQAFVGALEGQRASKGVFITASQFTTEAREYVEGLSRRVVLIDGDHLADLMIRFGVGVTTRETYDVKELDEDFFVDELG